MGLLRVDRRELQGDLRASSSALRGYKKAGERLFTMACSDWTGGDGLRLKEGRFRINFRKNFFTLRVMRHWA